MPEEVFDVFAALRARHSNGERGHENTKEWAFFENVRAAIGYDVRTADAVAMNTWRSRGLAIHGYEVKCSRSDWLRELRNPKKAEDSVFRYCDYWWLVVNDAAIVKPGELPSNWGLLAPKGNALAAQVEAPKLEPDPLSRTFVASLLRRAYEESQNDRAIAARVSAEVKQVEEATKRQVALDLGGAATQLVRLRESVEAFQKASGISIDYRFDDPAKIGAAVRVVLEDRTGEIRRRLEQLRDSAKRIAKSADEELAKVPPPAAPEEDAA